MSAQPFWKPWPKFNDGPIWWRCYRWGTLATFRWGLILAPFRWHGHALALAAWPRLLAEWLDVSPEEEGE